MLLWAHYFPSRGSSGGPYLAFPAQTALTPQVWGPPRGFSQLLGVLIRIEHSGTGEVNTGWVQGHTRPVERQTLAKTHGPSGLLEPLF